MWTLILTLFLGAYAGWEDLPRREGEVELSVQPASQSAHIYTGIEADQGFGGRKRGSDM